jgi:hypothetical protein
MTNKARAVNVTTSDQDLTHVLGVDHEEQLPPAYSQLRQITLSAPLIHEELQRALGPDLPCDPEQAHLFVRLRV